MFASFHLLRNNHTSVTIPAYYLIIYFGLLFTLLHSTMGSDHKPENSAADPYENNQDQNPPKDLSPNAEKPAEDASADIPTSNSEDDASSKARQRQERFKALQARAVCFPLNSSFHGFSSMFCQLNCSSEN